MTVLKNMSEAKNMALKAKLILNEKNTKFDGGNRRHGVEKVERVGANKVVDEKERNFVEKPSGSGEKKDERAMEKQPIESKEA